MGQAHTKRPGDVAAEFDEASQELFSRMVRAAAEDSSERRLREAFVGGMVNHGVSRVAFQRLYTKRLASCMGEVESLRAAHSERELRLMEIDFERALEQGAHRVGRRVVVVGWASATRNPARAGHLVLGDTLLHIAARRNSVRIVRFLLQSGAAEGLANGDGLLPLQVRRLRPVALVQARAMWLRGRAMRAGWEPSVAGRGEPPSVVPHSSIARPTRSHSPTHPPPQQHS